MRTGTGRRAAPQNSGVLPVAQGSAPGLTRSAHVTHWQLIQVERAAHGAAAAASVPGPATRRGPAPGHWHDARPVRRARNLNPGRTRSRRGGGGQRGPRLRPRGPVPVAGRARGHLESWPPATTPPSWPAAPQTTCAPRALQVQVNHQVVAAAAQAGAGPAPASGCSRAQAPPSSSRSPRRPGRAPTGSAPRPLAPPWPPAARRDRGWRRKTPAPPPAPQLETKGPGARARPAASRGRARPEGHGSAEAGSEAGRRARDRRGDRGGASSLARAQAAPHRQWHPSWPPRARTARSSCGGGRGRALSWSWSRPAGRGEDLEGGGGVARGKLATRHWHGPNARWPRPRGSGSLSWSPARSRRRRRGGRGQGLPCHVPKRGSRRMRRATLRGGALRKGARGDCCL
eukprot:449895-Rhodomonas_salina.1